MDPSFFAFMDARIPMSVSTALLIFSVAFILWTYNGATLFRSQPIRITPNNLRNHD